MRRCVQGVQPTCGRSVASRPSPASGKDSGKRPSAFGHNAFQGGSSGGGGPTKAARGSATHERYFDRTVVQPLSVLNVDSRHSNRLVTSYREATPSGSEPPPSPYLLELGSWQYQVCVVADALEADLGRIHYELLHRPCLFTIEESVRRRVVRKRKDTGAVIADEMVDMPYRYQPTGSPAMVVATCKKVLSVLKPKRKASPATTSKTLIAEQEAGGIITELHRVEGHGEVAASDERAMVSHGDGGAAGEITGPKQERMLLAFRRSQLNYYYRLNMVPKRHIGYGVYHTLWNAFSASMLAVGAAVSLPMRAFYSNPAASDSPLPSPPIRVAQGVAWGVSLGGAYLVAGFVVSPIVHISQSLLNMTVGVRNVFQAKWTFDSSDGVYVLHNAADNKQLRPQLVERMHTLLGVGMREFNTRRMKSEGKWHEHIAKLGFSKSANRAEDPYEILQLQRDATIAEVRTSYRTMSKMYHPDVFGSQHPNATESEKQDAKDHFDAATKAYRILSDPAKKRAFDSGGQRAVDNQDDPNKNFMAGNSGDLMERAIGGQILRDTFLGTMFRSHWHMKFQYQCNASLHELEELQVIRMRIIAAELLDILNVHVQQGAPEQRSLSGDIIVPGVPANAPANKQEVPTDQEFTTEFKTRLARYLAVFATEAPAGKELLLELGRSLEVTARVFLGLDPWYSNRLLTTKMLFSGMDRMKAGFTEDVKGKGKEELQRKAAVEFFNMEWDNIILDAHVLWRFIGQCVAQSADANKYYTLSGGTGPSGGAVMQPVGPEVHTMRLRALWYVSLQMKRNGAVFGRGFADDHALIKHLQQAAKNAKHTAPRF